MICQTLRKHGYDVQSFANGDEAIETVRNAAFDILITDMVVPGTEGIELVAEIKNLRPEVHVLAISGSGLVGRSTYLSLAQAHGADAILEKPFKPEQLLEKLVPAKAVKTR